nr:MAG: hypothetical protein [Molluscum contagiosum virus]
MLRARTCGQQEARQGGRCGQNTRADGRGHSSILKVQCYARTGSLQASAKSEPEREKRENRKKASGRRRPLARGGRSGRARCGRCLRLHARSRDLPVARASTAPFPRESAGRWPLQSCGRRRRPERQCCQVLFPEPASFHLRPQPRLFECRGCGRARGARRCCRARTCPLAREGTHWQPRGRGRADVRGQQVPPARGPCGTRLNVGVTALVAGEDPHLDTRPPTQTLARDKTGSASEEPFPPRGGGNAARALPGPAPQSSPRRLRRTSPETRSTQPHSGISPGTRTFRWRGGSLRATSAPRARHRSGPPQAARRSVLARDPEAFCKEAPMFSQRARLPSAAVSVAQQHPSCARALPFRREAAREPRFVFSLRGMHRLVPALPLRGKRRICPPEWLVPRPSGRVTPQR